MWLNRLVLHLIYALSHKSTFILLFFNNTVAVIYYLVYINNRGKQHEHHNEPSSRGHQTPEPERSVSDGAVNQEHQGEQVRRHHEKH